MLLLILGCHVLLWLLRFLNKLYLRLFQRLWLSHSLVDGLRYVWVDANALSGFIYLRFISFARNQLKVVKILITIILISCWFWALWILWLCSVCMFGNGFGLFWEFQDIEEIVATLLWNALGLLIINTTPWHFLKQRVFIVLLHPRLLKLQWGWHRVIDHMSPHGILTVHIRIEYLLKMFASTRGRL